MTTHALGQMFALLAAVTWAFAVILFKRCGDHISPISLNIFKNSIGISLLTITLIVNGDNLDTLRHSPPGDIYILMISGVLGIALADTVFFYALNLVGVGIISIVDCTYSPFTFLFSYLLLSEKLTVIHYVGAGLILGGISIASRHPLPRSRTRLQIVLGITLGALAMALMAVGIVFAKPVLDLMQFPLIWATTIRMTVGTAALALVTVASRRRRAYWSVFRPSKTWWLSVPASVLGAYLAMVFWVAGFKYTYASVAAVLNQTSVIIAMVLATVILKESLSWRKITALGMALCGVLLMLLLG